MGASTFTERSLATENSMLALKTSRALNALKAKNGAKLSTAGRKDLENGASLLSTIIGGSILVEGKERQGFVASHAGLEPYERALSAAELLQLTSQSRSLSNILVAYSKSLRRIIAGDKVDADQIDTLSRFFAAVADAFFADVQSSLGPTDEPMFTFLSP